MSKLRVNEIEELTAGSGFLPPGRTTSAMSDFLTNNHDTIRNVLDYGCPTNGTSSAVTAIQAALDDANRGDIVWCPPIANGYLVDGAIVIPKGRTLMGDYRGLAGTNWSETTELGSTTVPGSTFFRMTDTSDSQVVLRTNSHCKGVVFWYPNQNWDVTDPTETFTSYPAAIQLGNAIEDDPANVCVSDCHFMGATTWIGQYATDGTSVKSVFLKNISGVAMGSCIKLRRATKEVIIDGLVSHPSYITNYVSDGSVGGDAADFRVAAGRVSAVLHLGALDGFSVSNVVAWGVKYFAWYEDDFVTSDSNDGAAGNYTNLVLDGVYQAFRVERGDHVWPINVTNFRITPAFRPNGVAGDSSAQALVSFKTTLAEARVHFTNGRVDVATNPEFTANYSGQADYAFHADGALGSDSFVFVDQVAFDNFGTGVVPSALLGSVYLGKSTQDDTIQRLGRLANATATYASNVSTDSLAADLYQVTVTDTNNFTIDSPDNPQEGHVLTFMIYNNSGGAMGTITWSGFKLSGAFTNPANTKIRMITFVRRGSDWREITRTAADQDA